MKQPESIKSRSLVSQKLNSCFAFSNIDYLPAPLFLRLPSWGCFKRNQREGAPARPNYEQGTQPTSTILQTFGNHPCRLVSENPTKSPPRAAVILPSAWVTWGPRSGLNRRVSHADIFCAEGAVQRGERTHGHTDWAGKTGLGRRLEFKSGSLVRQRRFSPASSMLEPSSL